MCPQLKVVVFVRDLILHRVFPDMYGTIYGLLTIEVHIFLGSCLCRGHHVKYLHMPTHIVNIFINM